MIDNASDEILRTIDDITGLNPNVDEVITPTKRKYRKKYIQETEPIIEDYITELIEQPITTIKQEPKIAIPITSLAEWMKRYKSELPENTDIKTVTAGVKGVDSDEYLFFSIPHPKGGYSISGNKKRELLVFKNANKIPVLDLPISEISIYSSSFKMVHPFNNNYCLKSYGGKAALVVTMTENLIPYYIIKIKNNNAVLFKENNINICERLNELANREIIKMLYKVVENCEGWPQMKTNGDMCSYFLNLQKDIRDNLHHIKLDNIMIGLITGKFPTTETSTHVGRQILNEEE